MKNSINKERKKIQRFLTPGIHILIILFFAACGSSKSTGIPADLDKLRELVNSREFQVEKEWANPLGGSRINLIGNPNFIRFKGDSVDVFLPYFGVRRSGGGYGGRDGGIEFEGLARNLSIEEDDSRERITIKFEGRQRSESLSLTIMLFANGNASTAVNSSERDPIFYQGDIRELPERFR